MSNLRSISPRLDSWHPSLFDLGRPELASGFDGLARRDLPPDAWVDHVPGWLSGSAELFEILLDTMGWSHHVVTMYGERLDQPRLTAVWRGEAAHPVAGPLIEQMRAELSQRYGVRFRSVGLNLYRDGNDSVAWHGDRVARDRARATIAIVSLGEPRPFRLRPKGGGASIGYAAGNGDLLVMGGSCQRTWQHSVPKVHRAGPRISVTFRHELLRGPYEPA
ncbi:MAG: alpha-ketoglutarate-dependent dioxygenase AlkB family protein [Acidimicrobiales bacterium]